jgi:hypothetical protein
MAWNDMSMMQVMHYPGGPMAYAQEQIGKGALHVVAYAQPSEETLAHYKEYRGEDYQPLEGRREMIQMGQAGEGWVGNFKVGDMLDITDPQNPKGITWKEFHDVYKVSQEMGKDVRTPEAKPGFEPIVDTRVYADEVLQNGGLRVAPKLPGYFDMVQTDRNVSFLDANGEQHDVEKGGFIGFPLMGPSTYSPESFTYDQMMNEIGIVKSSGKDIMQKEPQTEGRIRGEQQPAGRQLPDISDIKGPGADAEFWFDK